MAEYAPGTRLISPRNGPPPVMVSIELDINWEALYQALGSKALRNASRKARCLGGIITVKVKEVKS